MRELRFTLFPLQDDFVFDDARFAAFMGGIGSGKSEAGVIKGLRYAWTHPDSLGLVLGPTFRNLKFTTRARWLQRLPAEWKHYWNENDGHLVIRHPTRTISHPGKATRPDGGSQVLFWSAEGEAVIDRVRGIEIAWCHIEEGPLVAEQMFLVAMGRLRQVAPKGAPSWRQQLWVTGTHKGRDWVFRYFETQEDDDGRPRAVVGPIWHAKIEDNTFLDPEYVASLRAFYRGAWAAQELDGGHAKFEGLIYPGFDRSTHVYKGALPRLKRVVYGVDWGFLYAPVIAVGETHDDQLIVAGEWYERDVQPEEQVTGAKELRDGLYSADGKTLVRPGLGGSQFFTDKSRPENRVAFNRAGLFSPEFEQGKVDEGIREVTARLDKRRDGKPGLLVHESCRNVISEFESYVWAKRPKAMSPGEEWKQEPAAGQKDHGMDSVRYAVMGLRVPPSAADAVAADPYYDPRADTKRRLWGGDRA